jgi:hypothetical protein
LIDATSNDCGAAAAFCCAADPACDRACPSGGLARPNTKIETEIEVPTNNPNLEKLCLRCIRTSIFPGRIESLAQATARFEYYLLLMPWKVPKSSEFAKPLFPPLLAGDSSGRLVGISG